MLIRYLLFIHKSGLPRIKAWKKLLPRCLCTSLSFAHELYKELNVPIGILLSVTVIPVLKPLPNGRQLKLIRILRRDSELMRKADPLINEGKEAYELYYEDLKMADPSRTHCRKGGKVPTRPNLPGIAGMWRGPSQFFNGKIAPVIPYAIRGAIWCQGTSNGGDGRIYASRMEALVKVGGMPGDA